MFADACMLSTPVHSDMFANANVLGTVFFHLLRCLRIETNKKGKGATVVGGKMIDEVHFKRARALLELVNGLE